MKNTIRIFFTLTIIMVLISLTGCSKKEPVFVEPTVMDNPDLPSIELNGIKFHSEVFGEENETTIIALHGGPGGDYRNLLNLKALSDQYKVVFFDQRGSGLTQRVEKEQITMDDFIADLDAFVEYYGEGKAILIGHSWGSMLGVDYTRRYPEKVIQLVIAEPGFLTPEMFDEFNKRTNGMKPKFTKELRQHLVETFFDSKRTNKPDKFAERDYFLNQLITGLNVKDHPLGGYYKEGDIRNGDPTMWRFGSLVSSHLPSTVMDKKGKFNYSFSEGIEKYQPQVLMMVSEYNTIIGANYQEKHMELFNNIRMEIIEDSGHTMFGEQPEACLEVIRGYLE